ncbi:MAG: VWA domain-containing protein [Elusimicrobia bacterium]|nr:VWA domain-containing protein [Elusimicrobiota bacterium]
MTFARPAALWLLLLLPLLAAYERRWGLWARARLNFPSFKILSGGLRPPTKEHFLAALRLAALGLVVIALARPQRGQTREEVTTPATDIMLVLDLSDSMRSLDFKPRNRFQAAMEVLRQFIKDRPRDRLGLVVFAREAFTQCPLTLDHGALLGFLDNLRIGLVDPDRTAIGSALATATARLKGSAAKSKIIVLLTDGRSNFGEVDPVTAAKAAAALGLRVHTVGAGLPAAEPLKSTILFSENKPCPPRKTNWTKGPSVRWPRSRAGAISARRISNPSKKPTRRSTRWKRPTSKRKLFPITETRTGPSCGRPWRWFSSSFFFGTGSGGGFHELDPGLGSGVVGGSRAVARARRGDFPVEKPRRRGSGGPRGHGASARPFHRAASAGEGPFELARYVFLDSVLGGAPLGPGIPGCPPTGR